MISRASFRAMTGLENDLEYLQRVAGPRAVTMTINKVRAKVKTALVKKIWSNTTMLPAGGGVDGLDDPTKAALKTKIKRKHIAKRIFTSRALGTKQYSTVRGYMQPIPVISVAQTKQRKTGKLVTKGSYIKARTPGKRAKDQTPKPGGVKIAGVMLPNMFLQLVQKQQLPQIMYRKQEKTWKPGNVGWDWPPGSKPQPRMPYDVAKFNLSKIFNKYFEDTVRETTEKHWADEYDRALGVAAGRILANNSK